jgi:hypothetical protein
MYRRTFFLVIVLALMVPLLPLAVGAVPPLQEECDSWVEEDGTLVVKCWLDEYAAEPVLFEPIWVSYPRPLQLDIVGGETERLYFRLEIDKNDYPSADQFELWVKAIPKKYMTECLWESGWPDVAYLVANPFAFSVEGISEFQEVSVSIGIEKSHVSHGITIFHDGETLDFPARVIWENNFPLVKSDSIYGCCRANAH